MLVSSFKSRYRLRSATRSVSCLPPPLVRRIKGMRFCCKWSSVSRALGSGRELRRRTPSMLAGLASGFVRGWKVERHLLEGESKVGNRFRVTVGGFQLSLTLPVET